MSIPRLPLLRLANFSATNKPAKAQARKLRQMKRFPPQLKSIARSSLHLKSGNNKNEHGIQMDIEFDRKEAVELLSQLRRRHAQPRSSQRGQPPGRWLFTASEDKEAIQTPSSLPTARREQNRSRNERAPRLQFMRQPANPPANTPTPAPPAPSRVVNSCPFEPSSSATHDIASLCGTASLRRYKLPPPPSIPSGLGTPPDLNIDQEIQMWEEGVSSRQREMTPPDDITEGMASWGDIPNENRPLGTQGQSERDRTAPVNRQVLGDITAQFAHPPPPSMSGVDLTAHLMSLVESLEPSRGVPRRRRQGAQTSEPQQPPHRTVRSSSFASSQLSRRHTHTQPPPMRIEGRLQLMLHSSTVPEQKRGPMTSKTADPRPECCPTTDGGVGLSKRLPPTETPARVARETPKPAPTAPRRSQRISSRRAGSGGAWSGTC